MAFGPILLIDDEPMIRELYRHLLAGLGHGVLAASDGEEAIAVIHAERPALVISDILMPGLSGTALCDRLRRAGEKRMPFLFLTATDSYAVLQDALLAGGDDLLIKGMDPARLEKRVQFWLRTPLPGLLPGPRAKALAIAAVRAGERDHPIAGLGVMGDGCLVAALALTRAAIAETGADYLARAELPLSFLGFLSGAIEQLCGDDLSALMRSADVMDAVFLELGPSWAGKAQPVFAEFEQLCGNDLFRAAERMGRQAAASAYPFLSCHPREGGDRA